MNTLVREIRGEVIADQMRSYEAKQAALALEQFDPWHPHGFIERCRENKKITLSEESLEKLHFEFLGDWREGVEREWEDGAEYRHQVTA